MLNIHRNNKHYYESVNGGEPACIDEQLPFDIPDSWVWVRLFSLGEIVGGGTPKTDVKSYWNNGDIPWLTPADMKWVKGKYVSSGQRNITALALQSSSAQLMPPGSVIYSSRAPIGYIAIAENDLCTNQGFKSLVPFSTQLSDYLYYALIAATPEIQSRASGTTFKEISGAEFGQTLVPFPPLAEQGNIVNKIESLLPEVETYNTTYHALSVLNEELPGKLKKSILQHAIQGKLVPQDPNDEPASVLLERIARERARMGKKAAKSMSRIERRDRGTYEIFPDSSEVDISDEIPFDLPTSWEWARLGSLCSKIGAGSTPKGGRAVYKNKGVLFLRSQNVYNDGLRLSNAAFIDESIDAAMSGSRVEPFDLLLNITGASIGRCAIVPEGIKRANINQHVLILRCIERAMLEYVHTCIISPLVFKNIMDMQVGATKEGLSAQKAALLLIPIPPVKEQYRIITALRSLPI